MKLTSRVAWCCFLEYYVLFASADKIEGLDYHICEWKYNNGGWLYCDDGYVAVGECRGSVNDPFCDGHTNGLECCRSTYGGTMFAIKSMLTEEMVFTLVLVAIFVDVCNSFDSEIYISQSEIKNTESTVPSFRKLKLKHH